MQIVANYFAAHKNNPALYMVIDTRSILCMRSLNTCTLTLGFEFHYPKIVTRMRVAPLNAKPIIIYQQKCYYCIPSWYLAKCYHVQQIRSWWTCSHPYGMRLAMVRGTRQSSVSAQVCTVRYKYTLLCFVVVCFRKFPHFRVIWFVMISRSPTTTTHPSTSPPEATLDTTGKCITQWYEYFQGPLLRIWMNYNPNMVK